ncbi:hypothetical protein PR002_g2576 [Phytophthora rubi]|uniref:Uncharacterized protein n=1 Tax=Phytophthora rubi TaxID=129364 RepID=A0A6A3NUK4_9STRA|nr:hypothetical protein PR002_g2576 [Phytophthora rubi]
MTLGEVEVEVHGARVESGGRGGREFSHGKDHLRLLPPSANWYCSKICDWGRSDDFGLLFAFGAKNSVFIYQVTSGDGRQDSSEDGVKVSFFAQLVRGKRDRRVTAVQFLTDTTGDLRLVCGGEEGSVQIWDVATLTMIEQHRKHKAEVMAVTVSDTLDANFVVAGDRQGRVSAWERDAGNVSVFMPISGDGIHSMAISPHDKALVAVGYRSGVLCLVDAAKGTIRHRLAGHDQEVQCVAWKATVKTDDPVVGGEEEDVESDSADPDVWLASSSRDKSIKVWKLASNSAEEPALDQVLRLPTGKQGMSFTQTKQLWLPVTWSVKDNETDKAPGKHCLWSGSFDGSLLRWEWSADKSQGQGKKEKKRAPCKPVAVKGGHNRMLFCIVLVPPGSATLPVSMLTVSLDRELRLWKEGPSSKSAPAAICVEKLTGLGGHAYSVSHNVATGLVAAGVGDQTIRLWNLGIDDVSTSNDYQCDLLWKGLQSKVTCVRVQPKDPPSSQKKPGKVKKPQEVETIRACPEERSASLQTQQRADTTDVVAKLSSADGSDAKTPAKFKKRMTIFHPETKLTPEEVAFACCKVYGAEKVAADLKANPAEGTLLTNVGRAQLREFFATEVKRFRDDREWENLANTLILQGNITEALRIVAKEGALSPTWLSYAPMAGLDVWREMTNLYAHQLDAQGDKKAAALHFLSIAKVRAAITCLRLLRFTIDVMSGSLIGAVEHLRDAFLLLAHSEDTGKVGELKSTSEEASSLRAGGLRLEVMTLLCPCGFASPNVLPQCGELAVEQLDTLVLWSSILLSQCRVVLATAVSTAKNSSTEGLMPSLGSLIGSFLHLLRVSFLGDEETLLCEGLKDVDNQSQLQTLLNEMLVAVHLLPDEPLTSQTQDLGCSAGEAKQDEESEDCVSRKQALIDDMNDVRSCLTWSDDSVK